MAALECQSNVIFLGSSCDIIDFLIVWQNLCINYAQYLDSRVRYGILLFFRSAIGFLFSPQSWGFSLMIWNFCVMGLRKSCLVFFCKSPEILSSM